MSCCSLQPHIESLSVRCGPFKAFVTDVFLSRIIQKLLNLLNEQDATELGKFATLSCRIWHEEIWLLMMMCVCVSDGLSQVSHMHVGSVDKLAPSTSGWPIQIHGKNFLSVTFVIPKEKESQDIYSSLARLSQPGIALGASDTGTEIHPHPASQMLSPSPPRPCTILCSHPLTIPAPSVPITAPSRTSYFHVCFIQLWQNYTIISDKLLPVKPWVAKVVFSANTGSRQQVGVCGA